MQTLNLRQVSKIIYFGSVFSYYRFYCSSKISKQGTQNYHIIFFFSKGVDKNVRDSSLLQSHSLAVRQQNSYIKHVDEDLTKCYIGVGRISLVVEYTYTKAFYTAKDRNTLIKSKKTE